MTRSAKEYVYVLLRWRRWRANDLVPVAKLIVCKSAERCRAQQNCPDEQSHRSASYDYLRRAPRRRNAQLNCTYATARQRISRSRAKGRPCIVDAETSARDERREQRAIVPAARSHSIYPRETCDLSLEFEIASAPRCVTRRILRDAMI